MPHRSPASMIMNKTKKSNRRITRSKEKVKPKTNLTMVQLSRDFSANKQKSLRTRSKMLYLSTNLWVEFWKPLRQARLQFLFLQSMEIQPQSSSSIVCRKSTKRSSDHMIWRWFRRVRTKNKWFLMNTTPFLLTVWSKFSQKKWENNSKLREEKN